MPGPCNAVSKRRLWGWRTSPTMRHRVQDETSNFLHGWLGPELRPHVHVLPSLHRQTDIRRPGSLDWRFRNASGVCGQGRQASSTAHTRRIPAIHIQRCPLVWRRRTVQGPTKPRIYKQATLERELGSVGEAVQEAEAGSRRQPHKGEDWGTGSQKGEKWMN